MQATTIDTATGPLTIVVDADGAVRAAGFTASVADLLPLIHSAPRVAVRPLDDLGPVTAAVRSYLDGDVTALNDVPVAQSGGEFMMMTWAALREVDPGEPVTYSALAARAGRPRAVRAAATACARNAVALLVPCHRIVRADGTLGGYRWGRDVKEWLLGHERRSSASRSPSTTG